MKKTISIILSIALVFSLAAILSSCGGEKEESKEYNSSSVIYSDDPTVFTDDPIAVSFVESTHDNFPKVYLNGEITNIMINTCYSYGSVNVCSVEGKPKIIGEYSFRKLTKSNTATKRLQQAKRNAAAIISECNSFCATTEEVDTLSAIHLSADALRSSPFGHKTMIIIDSGLCTTGCLDQTDNDFISASPQYVVDQLKRIHELPDLEGIHVIWYGLGVVSDPQSDIPNLYKDGLEELWKAIIEASGGTVEFKSNPIFGDRTENLPKVTSVSFPIPAMNTDNLEPKSYDTPVRFDESTLKFKPDSAQFVDINAAKVALGNTAKTLVSYPSFNIIIAGTTASAGNGDRLSYERASACKDILVSLGSDPAQIECVGLGCSERGGFHVPDLDANGNLIEKEAKKNRSIYIFSTTSEKAYALNAA